MAAIDFWPNMDPASLQAWLQTTGDWAPLVFIIIATCLMSVCVPKTAVSLTAGAMFGLGQGLALVMIVATLAAAVNYVISYAWMGRKRLNKYPTTDSFASAIVNATASAGWVLHLLIRLSPVPTMLISYSMGAIGARFAPYIFAAFAATLPQLLWVHSGTQASRVASDTHGTPAWLGLMVSLGVAAIATLLISREAKRQLRLTLSLPKDQTP